MSAKYMRVIAGTARGKKLWGPANRNIRPMTGIVKEYLFNIFREIIEESVAADLFAGTGSIGIEALSRGAKSISFVDILPESVDIIRRNLKDLKYGKKMASINHMDALQFLERSAAKKKKYDLIFADPPFAYNSLFFLIESIDKLPVLKRSGYFIIQHNQDIEQRLKLTNLNLFKFRKFGANMISIFQQGAKGEASDISGHI